MTVIKNLIPRDDIFCLIAYRSSALTIYFPRNSTPWEVFASNYCMNPRYSESISNIDAFDPRMRGSKASILLMLSLYLGFMQ